MKQLFSFISMRLLVRALPSFLAFASLVILFSACQKTGGSIEEDQTTFYVNTGNVSGNDVQNEYTGLDKKTVWELQQARAASSKYRNIKNAMDDGYLDINVILPNMGYHYLNPDLLDNHFDPTKPEILVYNKRANGSMELVAVEYAVPIPLTPELAPAGFSGSADVWTRNTGFDLWLLHAWVWHFNPDGVFAPMNMNVIVN